MTYDGYGRLQTKHLPQQNTGAASTWTYFADDTVQTATDARGATATYTYNDRHLVATIAYDPPAGVPDTPSVAFDYDAAGNRISMTDGLGSVGYTYDTLSQMTSETRIIDGVGTFPIVYEYHPTGQLKKITDPMNVSINYTYDSSGRTSTVTGSGTLYGGVSSYATNYKYRAWGALKQYSYGNSSQHLVSVAYTGRGQVSRYQATFNSPFATQSVTGQYQYGADGRLRSSTEETDHRHDRAYTYDHAARLTQALSGTEARGETPTPGWDPFKQSYGYNAWGNMTSRTGHHWGTNERAFTATYVNDRNTNSQWQYNANGDLLQQVNQQITRQYVYDAAGQQISVTEPQRRPNRPALTMTQTYDGDGQRVKNVQNSAILYEIRSTVLGARVIGEFHGQGVQTKGFVYANGGKLARQTFNEVTWVHEASDGTGEWESNGIAMRTLELDPLGDDVGVDDPYASGDGLGDYPNHGDPADFDTGCTLDGGPVICEVVIKWYLALHNRNNFLSQIYNTDPRTAPTFPSTINQITWANILRDALEDTPFGDFLYPKPEKLWRTINPFVPPGTLFADSDDPDTLVQNSLKEAERLLGLDPCAKFIRGKLGLDPAAIMPKLRQATLKENHDQMSTLGTWVRAVQTGNVIDFYKPFFVDTRPPNLDPRRVMNGPAALITSKRERKAQGQDTLHEGIHLLSGMNDVQLANLLLEKGKEPFTDREKASDFWHQKLIKDCH